MTIYMDNAASTAVRPEVVDAMVRHMRERRGNPSSIHREGRLARKAVNAARKHVAALINAGPDEIVFTSGGTESNNVALCGVARSRPGCGIITTSIEHDSVLEPCAALKAGRHHITHVMPDGAGMVSPRAVRSAVSGRTGLVSVMAANNEVGTIQDIPGMVSACGGVPFHCDMVQAAGKVSIDVGRWGVDLASISSHKIGGPKGVGALYVRRGTRLDPLMWGGGQEGGLRSGTENVPGIVGFGEACRLALAHMSQEIHRVEALRDSLLRSITDTVPGVVLNGHPRHRLPGNVHLAFLGVSGEDLIIKLDEYGVAASTGSACSAHAQKESHVLRAMGAPADVIYGSLRLSLGPDNTQEEVDQVADIIPGIVRELRAVSPLREKYRF